MMFLTKISDTKIIYLMALLFLLGTLSQFIRIKEHKENDHWVYYRTSKRIEEKKVREIYSFNDGAFPYQYSPPTLMLLSWMSQFSETSSRKIWLIAQSFLILSGFFFLKKTIELIYKSYSIHSVFFSFLIFFRYFIDSLYCGQISGLLFFLFALGIYLALIQKNTLSNVLFSGLALIKIIPGILIILNLIKSNSKAELKRQIISLILFFIFISIFFYFWFLLKFGIENNFEFKPIITKWFEICSAGQQYFDGSTSKSQSLRAFLLRTIGNGFSTESIWKTSITLIISGLFAIWYKIKKLNDRSIYLGFMLGIITFVLIMPESLPYQIFNLMIPTIFLCSSYFNKKTNHKINALLILVIVFCTLPTADLVGHTIANTIQSYSIPFFIFVLYFYVITKECLNQKNELLNL